MMKFFLTCFVALMVLVVPFGTAQAVSFSCVEKSTTATSATLRVAGAGVVVHSIRVLPPNSPNNSYAIVPTTSSYPTQAGDVVLNVYEDLQSGAAYTVRAFDGAGTMVQEIVNCAFIVGASTTGGTTPSTTTPTTTNQCTDGIDNQIGDGKNYGYGANNGDRKADRYGTIEFEADPSCAWSTATEEVGDDLAYDENGNPASVIPCTNKCSFSDVFRLFNNIISFFFKYLLAPIFVIMLIYAGYKYIAAQGNPSKVANLKSMLWNFIGGIIFILCAWLIVRTIMVTALNDNFKNSGVQFLGD